MSHWNVLRYAHIVVNLFIDFFYAFVQIPNVIELEKTGTLSNNVFKQRIGLEFFLSLSKNHILRWCSFALRDQIANLPPSFANDSMNSAKTGMPVSILYRFIYGEFSITKFVGCKHRRGWIWATFEFTFISRIN